MRCGVARVLMPMGLLQISQLGDTLGECRRRHRHGRQATEENARQKGRAGGGGDATATAGGHLAH